MPYSYRQLLPHGHGNLTLSCGQKDRLRVSAAAADFSHGRTCCSYISEQKRQRSKKQRQCNISVKFPRYNVRVAKNKQDKRQVKPRKEIQKRSFWRRFFSSFLSLLKEKRPPEANKRKRYTGGQGRPPTERPSARSPLSLQFKYSNIRRTCYERMYP